MRERDAWEPFDPLPLYHEYLIGAAAETTHS